MKRIALIATLLAFVVVMLGAYTRLKDAGLGCPDWPGCYGQWVVPDNAEHIAMANARYPAQPLEHPKAWAEMTHRYFASALGFLIVLLAAYGWRYPSRTSRNQKRLASFLLVLVVLQGLLGKYTVTMSLYPGIVMLHLLGGFTTLTLLGLLTASCFRQTNAAAVTAGTITAADTKNTEIATNDFSRKAALSRVGIACLLILLAQIALGGWTSANYAARSCPGLPACTPDWISVSDFSSAFSLPPLDDKSFEYAPHLDVAAKIAIQMTHRIMAVITLIILCSFYFLQWLNPGNGRLAKNISLIGFSLLVTQFALGLLNIVLDLPLAIAVAHNGVAALSLLSIVLLNYSLYIQGSIHHEPSRHPDTRHTAGHHSMA